MVKNKTVEITKFINNDFTREDLEKLSEEMKMVPLTYDFSFKRVFNWKLDLLADFLISVLELNHINPKYCELKWLPNEMPKENKKEYKKNTRYLCKS